MCEKLKSRNKQTKYTKKTTHSCLRLELTKIFMSISGINQLQYIKIIECFYNRKVLVYAITEMNLADIVIKMTKGNHIKIMYDSMYVQNIRNHSYNLC